MTRRVKTKRDREFQIVSEVKNEDGTSDIDVRVKNRPGRRHGGPLWNQIPYPMTVQERIAEAIMQQRAEAKEREAEAAADLAMVVEPGTTERTVDNFVKRMQEKYAK